jgi:myo-inositol-1(or 4)-monophosphatase
VLLSELLDVALEATDMAGGIIRRAVPDPAPKGDRDEVTPTEFLIEQALREFLRARAPGTGFCGEEEGRFPPAEVSWVLDPVDGTVNLVRGLPLFGVSLALVSGNRPVLGVIDLGGARYWAYSGGGAWQDGRRIRVAVRARALPQAVIAVGDYATGPDAEEKNAARLEVTRQLAGRAMRVRMLGSAAADLAWTAAGRLDGMVTLSNRPWDMAAGAVIAAEAGATVTDADGDPHTLDSAEIIAAATPQLAAEIARIVRTARSAVPEPVM